MAVEFGKELQLLMALGSWNNTLLAEALRAHGCRISDVMVYYYKYGRRIPPPEVIEVICRVMKCDGEQRHRLHRAAAIDHGYDVGPAAGHA